MKIEFWYVEIIHENGVIPDEFSQYFDRLESKSGAVERSKTIGLKGASNRSRRLELLVRDSDRKQFIGLESRQYSEGRGIVY